MSNSICKANLWTNKSSLGQRKGNGGQITNCPPTPFSRGEQLVIARLTGLAHTQELGRFFAFVSHWHAPPPSPSSRRPPWRNHPRLPKIDNGELRMANYQEHAVPHGFQFSILNSSPNRCPPIAARAFPKAFESHRSDSGSRSLVISGGLVHQLRLQPRVIESLVLEPPLAQRLRVAIWITPSVHLGVNSCIQKQ